MSQEVAREVLILLEDFSAFSWPPANVGEWTGKFEIMGTLGRGGMGYVLSAKDTELNRPVALKFLTPDITMDPDATQKLLAEAQTTSALNHANIVTIYEVLRSGSSIAIVMELVEGQSLRQLCENPLPADRAIDIGRQIARALGAAHAKGIVHRDIKPENIMLRQDGCAKVLDFGLARNVSNPGENSSTGLSWGTLFYMSPEQARREPPTPASDVFSLGLVLHELLTGRHAFPEDSPIETAHAIMAKEPSELPGDVPAELRSVIKSMLAKAPSDRPTAAQVAAQLDEIQAVESPRRLHAQRRARWIAVLVTLVIAGAGMWFAKSSRDSRDLRDLTMKPLTSQPGWEWAPALSPTGDAIAFTWTTTLDGPRQLYVKRDSEAEPTKLAGLQAGQIGYLAWSPDSKRIAFKGRIDDRGALYSVAGNGSTVQKILDLGSEDLSTSIDWSPEGNLLAFSDRPPESPGILAIYLYDLRTGEKRKVTTPPSAIWGDWSPKFSPDGRTIAFKRVTGFWADDIYLVPVQGGRQQRLTAHGRSIYEHTWLSDGKSLLVSCQCSGTVHGIWQFPLDDATHPRQVAQGSVDAFAPSTGRHTNKMAWVNMVWDLNVYRIAATGAGKPERLIASTLRDYNPVYAPDGRIAWISDRSGTREIWIAREDGSGQTQLTRLNGPAIDNLQWSYDGRYLAFDSRLHGQTDIFMLECPQGTLRCGEPKALNVSPAVSPGWSADSQTVYFCRNPSGKCEIWKQALSGGTPVLVAPISAYWPRESPDGKWLYLFDADNGKIVRMPVSTKEGEPRQLVPVIGRENRPVVQGWAITGKEVVFVSLPEGTHPAAIRAFNPNTKKLRTVLNLTNVVSGGGTDIGLSVSSDGKWILYTQPDRSGSNIMMADKGH